MNLLKKRRSVIDRAIEEGEMEKRNQARKQQKEALKNKTKCDELSADS